METLFIGRNIIFLPEIDSTNSYASELLKNVNVSEGTLVHTSNQTQGKGQRGNSWEAEIAANVTASIILKPGFLEIKNQFFLYQISALACYDVMAELLNNSQYDIKIKWPNDILVNRKKIAGILIENGVIGNTLSCSVIGLGININQENFQETLNATSIFKLTYRKLAIDNVLKLLCKNLEKYYLQLKNGKLNEISTNYLKHLFGLNNWIEFEIDSKKTTQFVKAISEEGLLVLKDELGHEKEYDVKEIKWII
ncbi:MAG: biotin--[acetyl-CoA-carboxylase] ligase [Bacteroidota bacterium]|nr:biotin--[acetyl-CoA-carboxylase] ligase [Bacteroidota bacterium]